MRVLTLSLGAFCTNCYIVISNENNAVVIDPADDINKIMAKIDEYKLSVKKILLTHGHFDHTGACNLLREKTGAKVVISSIDNELLADGDKAFAFLMPEKPYYPVIADEFVEDGDIITLDEINFTTMLTPGHTAGSVMYITDTAIFAGDTIFAGSVGRTDGYSGSSAAQLESLRKISAINGRYRIYCGHGPSTSLDEEKDNNPFLYD